MESRSKPPAADSLLGLRIPSNARPPLLEATYVVSAKYGGGQRVAAVRLECLGDYVTPEAFDRIAAAIETVMDDRYRSALRLIPAGGGVAGGTKRRARKSPTAPVPPVRRPHLV